MSNDSEPKLTPAQTAIAQVMATAAGNYVASAIEIDMWNEIIDRYGDPAVVSFIRHHVSQSRFAPHPSDALKFLGATSDGASAMLVLGRQVARVGPWESPKFEDPALSRAVDLMGGWEKVCQDMPDPSDRFAYDAFQKRFEAALRSAQSEVSRGVPVAPLLGRHAANSLSLDQRQQLALAMSPQPADLQVAGSVSRLMHAESAR